MRVSTVFSFRKRLFEFREFRSRNLPAIVLALFSLFVFAIGLKEKGATTAFDERLYFNIAKIMYNRGDFLIPPSTVEALPGHSFDETPQKLQPSLRLPAFYKGPLLYWLFMAGFALFGVGSAVARGVIAVFSAATVVVAYLLGRKFFGERTGFLAGLLLLSSLGFFQLGREMLLDLPFLFLILFGVYLCAQRFFVVGMAAFGVSSLLKGPLGPLLGLLIFLPYALLFRDQGKISRRSFWIGVGIAAVISLFYPVALALKGYGSLWFRHFVIAENFGKFEMKGRSPLVLVTSFLSYDLPWSLLFLFSLFYLPEKWSKRSSRFVVSGFFIPFFFFLFPAQKIDRYVLFMLPFAAIYLAQILQEKETRWLRAAGAATGLILFFLGASTAAVVSLIHNGEGIFLAVSAFFLCAAACFFLVRGKYAAGAAGAALFFSLMPPVLSLPSLLHAKKIANLLSSRPCYATDSVVDEVFAVTGMNCIEVHSGKEIEDAFSYGYFLVSTHELNQVQPSVLKTKRMIFSWQRWQPALRFPIVWKAVRSRDPEPLLEKIFVFSN